MGFVDAKNIYEESDAVFFIAGLIGLRSVQIRKTKIPGYIYTAFLLLAYWALYFYTFNDLTKIWEHMGHYTKSTKTRIYRTFINPFFLTLTVITSLASARKMRHLYDQIYIIDEKLKYIEVPLDYGKATRIDTARIFETIFVTILFNLFEYFPQAGPDTTHFFDLVWIVDAYPQFANSIAIASFAIVLAKIRRRLEGTNEIIARMMIPEKKLTSTLEADMNIIYKLRLLNKIHGKLLKVASSLNEAYGFYLLTSFVLYFLASCAHLKAAYMALGGTANFVDVIIESLWGVFYISKYVYVIRSCHSAIFQARLSGQMLREKWTDVDHHPLKQETDALIRQIESRNLQLTACNFFVIDYPALKTFIVSLVAYITAVSYSTVSCDKK